MTKDASNKKFWDRMAPRYTRMMNKKASSFGAVSGMLSDHLGPSMSVLELACGTGQFTFPLSGKVGSWEASDFSEEMVKRTEAAYVEAGGGNVKFSVKDATNLDCADSVYDAVVIANALHIMPSPDKALAEIHRVLKPGGLLLAPTFVYEGKIPRLKLWFFGKAGFRTYNEWTAAELESYVGERGFDILERELVDCDPVPQCVLVGRKRLGATDA